MTYYDLKKQKTKARILATASKLFGLEKQGLRVTVLAITQQAKVSKPTFYSYFISLKQLKNELAKIN